MGVHDQRERLQNVPGSGILMAERTFEPGHVPGLAFFDMEAELSHLIGRQVDLNTPQFLSRYFRDTVLAEAEVLYDAA